MSRSQLKAKFIDFLDENRLIFVVLSDRFQRIIYSLERPPGLIGDLRKYVRVVLFQLGEEGWKYCRGNENVVREMEISSGNWECYHELITDHDDDKRRVTDKYD